MKNFVFPLPSTNLLHLFWNLMLFDWACQSLCTSCAAGIFINPCTWKLGLISSIVDGKWPCPFLLEPPDVSLCGSSAKIATSLVNYLKHVIPSGFAFFPDAACCRCSENHQVSLVKERNSAMATSVFSTSVSRPPVSRYPEFGHPESEHLLHLHPQVVQYHSGCLSVHPLRLRAADHRKMCVKHAS